MRPRELTDEQIEDVTRYMGACVRGKLHPYYVEDVVGTAWEKLLRRNPEFEVFAQLLKYAAIVIRNTMTDVYRSIREQRYLFEDEPLPFRDEYEAVEAAVDFRMEVACLDDRDQRVLGLVAQGYRPKDMEHPGNFRVIVHRARAKLGH